MILNPEAVPPPRPSRGAARCARPGDRVPRDRSDHRADGCGRLIVASPPGVVLGEHDHDTNDPRRMPRRAERRNAIRSGDRQAARSRARKRLTSSCVARLPCRRKRAYVSVPMIVGPRVDLGPVGGLRADGAADRQGRAERRPRSWQDRRRPAEIVGEPHIARLFEIAEVDPRKSTSCVPMLK